MGVQKQQLTQEQGLQKLRYYCGYQERSHYEVQQKLWELRINKSYHDAIISALIEEDYLNEERFAIHFAGGKFRMNEWGKKKIYYALKEKRVSDYCIQKALKAIDEDDYERKLRELAEKKYNSLSRDQYLVRKKKTIDYLLQKGFETDLANTVVNEIIKNEGL
ncbi:MAG: regulatory protein RecX [Chitinophagaceae bacterium]